MTNDGWKIENQTWTLQKNLQKTGTKWQKD